MKSSVFCLMIMLSMNIASFADAQWEELFNGKDLSGWKRLNGTARFYVENGTIAGQTVDGPLNTFLCTEKDYDDFILEFEIKIEEGLNSGVQIRSLSRSDYKNGQVHGYQVECDSSDRAWSGSILDEARRGWLYPLEKNPSARKAFRKGKWNKFRAEAYGNRIRTFVNGIECIDLIDDMTSKGFIGLQVHRIGKKKELIGRKVYWRNLRILTSNVKEHLSPVNYSVPQVSMIPNTVSEKQERLGWKLLWDGKTTNRWRGAGLDRFPQKGWKIQDGELIVLSSARDRSQRGGDIITVDKFKNFELEVDFKYTKGANSGIKYFVNVEPDGSAIGCEYQILDDDDHPDAAQGSNASRTLASLFDLIGAENVLGKKVKRYEWNRARIVVNGDHVEHWLNGMKMVEYERNTQMWRALVAKSKYRQVPNFGAAKAGHILLQDHGPGSRPRSPF
ncbi:MAG: 3-keto-disaccharide hydrolase [Planctomycetota bacterium]